MNRLIHLDSEYTYSLSATFDKLEKSYVSIKEDYNFDLATTEITEAILKRLKVYYQTQEKTKIFLDKRYLTAGSDFFVESVLFFLRLFLHAKDGRLQAHSEKQIRPLKNAIRPDISIWDKDEVIAIIECKTQLGWNRNDWEQKYRDRNIKLQNEFPNAKSFLLVMTGVNWGGFGSHANLNLNYFCLLDDIWPINYSSPNQIMTPIERLFAFLE